MKIGIPKEIKNNENRVSCTPAGVFALCKAGHEVYVETNAGAGSGFLDKEYEEAGAQIKAADEVFALADLIVKVKEYLPQEYHYLREDQLVFTYLHIANDEAFANALLESKTTAIAYETVRDRKGGLPLLTPMSEVAGRMAVPGRSDNAAEKQRRTRVAAGGSSRCIPCRGCGDRRRYRWSQRGKDCLRLRRNRNNLRYQCRSYGLY